MMATVVDAPAQQPPTTLLPPTLGEPAGPGNPLGNQLFAPQPRTAQQPPAPPAASPAPPAGTLGTIPESALAPVTGGALADALASLAAPLPTAGLQRVAREVLIDQATVQTTDPLARSGALYALGFAEDAAGAAVEAQASDVAGRAATARALLAVGQVDQACRRVDVDNVPQDAEPGPTFELLEVLALCKAVTGATDAAGLIAGLLKEQGGADPLFFAALDALSGGGAGLPDLDRVKRLRPVHVALIRSAGVSLPAGYVARADLALLPSLVRDESLDIAARIAATERAVAAGLAPAGTLVGLYGVTPLDEGLLTQATGGGAPAGPLARAHQFALLAAAPDARERLRFIDSMYAGARSEGLGAAIAEAVGEDMAGIGPEPALGVAAPLAVEVLVRADRARAALGWVDAGEFPGPTGEPALSRFASHRNRALIALLAPDLGLGVAAGTLGPDAGGGNLGDAERAFITSEVTWMTALGDFVSPILAEIAGHPAPPPAASGPAALITALAPLAGVPLAEAGDDTVAIALAALAASGFETEARRLAVEALIARTGG